VFMAALIPTWHLPVVSHAFHQEMMLASAVCLLPNLLRKLRKCVPYTESGYK